MANSKDAAFTEITGLHRCFDKTPTWQQAIILRQGAKLKNLRAERQAIRRGYGRKIARLERELAARSNEAAKAAKMREALDQLQGAATDALHEWQISTGATTEDERSAFLHLTVARDLALAALEPQPIAEGLAGEVATREPDGRRCDCFVNGVSPEMCPHQGRA